MIRWLPLAVCVLALVGCAAWHQPDNAVGQAIRDATQISGPLAPIAAVIPGVGPAISLGLWLFTAIGTLLAGGGIAGAAIAAKAKAKKTP